MDAPLSSPDIPDGETTAYRGLVKGEEVGSGTLRIERLAKGYVQHGDMVIDDLRYEMEIAFATVNRTLLADSYRLETFDGEQPVAREEGWFRDVRALGFGGEVGAYPRSTLPLLGCAVGLRGLEFEKGERHHFALWLANTIWWEVEVHVERTEKVTVPAGSGRAWRVRARPSFAAVNKALDRIVGAVLPPFVLHFEQEPPHRLLRFEFPTGPFPWNPRATIEATTLS